MLLNAYSRSHEPLLTLPPLSTVLHLTVQYHIYCFIDLLDVGCEGLVFCLFEVLEIELRQRGTVLTMSQSRPAVCSLCTY